MKSTETSTGRHEKSGSNSNVVTSVEFVLRAELHEPVETDFVHSITGRIIAESEARGDEDAGNIRASLIQFSEALDHAAYGTCGTVAKTPRTQERTSFTTGVSQFKR
jgi:hypothetical protein